MDAKSISWPVRLFIVLSSLWIAIAFLIAEDDMQAFFGFGVIPIGIFWGIWWIASGFFLQIKKLVNH